MSDAQDAYGRGLMTIADRNALVEEYLPLVRHVVSRLPVAIPSFMDKDDIFAVGVLGLMNAAQTFNPAKGASFKTYAYLSIRGAVLDELRKVDIVPRSRRDRIKAFRRCEEELRESLGRDPTPEEIGSSMGLSVDQVDDLIVNMQAVSLLSLDEGGSEGGFRLQDCLGAANTLEPGDEAEKRELLERLGKAIEGLPENERRVIVLYYAEGLYMKEIGAVLGVTESRASQIHSRALFRLERSVRAASGAGA